MKKSGTTEFNLSSLYFYEEMKDFFDTFNKCQGTYFFILKQYQEERKMAANEHYIADYQKFGGIKLYKIHGFMGDYIALDNMIVERKLCSLEDAKRGRHKFYEKESGREIKFDEIPWK